VRSPHEDLPGFVQACCTEERALMAFGSTRKALWGARRACRGPSAGRLRQARQRCVLEAEPYRSSKASNNVCRWCGSKPSGTRTMRSKRCTSSAAAQGGGNDGDERWEGDGLAAGRLTVATRTQR
jgi:hypothetical protein